MAIGKEGGLWVFGCINMVTSLQNRVSSQNRRYSLSPLVFSSFSKTHLATIMSLFKIPDPPKTKLGRYRLLSPNAGVHVSPLQLGAMSIGDQWAEFGMGSMDKESSFKLLDAYYESGGNTIDTSNS